MSQMLDKSDCEKTGRALLKPHIHLKKIWFDDDSIELSAEVCDGRSLFSNRVYIGIHTIAELVKNLSVFRESVHGGIYDITLGTFGPEFASGGFHARLHFYERGHGKLYISTHQQSEHVVFRYGKVASESRLYLITEPVQLDHFTDELKALSAGSRDDASLNCYTE